MSAATDHIKGIVRLYSSSDGKETHCSAESLTRDLVTFVQVLERELDEAKANAKAWQHLHRTYGDEDTSLFGRVFGRRF